MSEYIPKVGDSCEFNLVGAGWTKCSIEAETRQFIIINAGGVEHHYLKGRVEFRPSKIKSEIERGKDIKDAFKNIGWIEPDNLVSPSCIGVVIDMIDAGYHNGPKTGAMIPKHSILRNVPHIRHDWATFLRADDLFDNYDVFSKIKD